jgi:hypothetical protein
LRPQVQVQEQVVIALEQGAVMMEEELPVHEFPLPPVKVEPGNLHRIYQLAARADHNWGSVDRQQEFLQYLSWALVVVAVLAYALPSPAQRYVPHP